MWFDPYFATVSFWLAAKEQNKRKRKQTLGWNAFRAHNFVNLLLLLLFFFFSPPFRLATRNRSHIVFVIWNNYFWTFMLLWSSNFAVTFILIIFQFFDDTSLFCVLLVLRAFLRIQKIKTNLFCQNKFVNYFHMALAMRWFSFSLAQNERKNNDFLFLGCCCCSMNHE